VVEWGVVPLSSIVALLAGCIVTTAPPDAREPEVCDNGEDDDFDGSVDCDDRDCSAACQEVCDDGVDNDGDGLVDCTDPGCAGACGEICDDGVDNDADGRLDCDDPDCADDCPEDCSNGVDDDLDGLSDCDDVDCASTCDGDGDGFVGVSLGGDDCDDGDPSVNPGADETCNGVDDDCDRDVDDDDDDLTGGTRFYADGDGDGWGNEFQRRLACAAPTGFLDSFGDCDDGDPDVHPGADERCNGVDDDCDTLVDDEDPDVDASSFVPVYDDLDGDGFGAGPAVGGACTPGPGEALTYADCDDADPQVFPGALELCGDGIDQDCDLDVDCDDADCASNPLCLTCGDFALAAGAPQTVFGSTSGVTNDSVGTCGGGAAQDETWLWTPTAAGTYTIDTVGSVYDTVLYVLDGCAGAQLACNDDFVGLQSRLTVSLSAGQTVLIVVDGYSSTSVGSYTLNVY
jgi:hypothetical protein